MNMTENTPNPIKLTKNEIVDERARVIKRKRCGRGVHRERGRHSREGIGEKERSREERGPIRENTYNTLHPKNSNRQNVITRRNRKVLCSV